jgi:hypothetical protein
MASLLTRSWNSPLDISGGEIMAKKAAAKKAEEKPEVNSEPVAGDEQLQETPKDTAIDKARPPLMGYDGYTDDDIIIPRYSIVQKSSAAVDKGAAVGSFISNLTGEEVEALRCTPILYTKGMVNFPKPYKKGQEPVCKSNDALKPSDRIAKPLAPTCNKIVKRRLVPLCEHAKWTKDDDGKSVPPACNLCYNVIFKNEESDMSFFMSFRSSALKAWKKFVTQMRMLQKNLFAVSLNLTTEQDENEYGVFYVPRLDDLEDHEPDSEKELVDLYHAMQMMDLDASFDDERNQGDDGEEMDEGDASFDTSELEGEKF